MEMAKAMGWSEGQPGGVQLTAHAYEDVALLSYAQAAYKDNQGGDLTQDVTMGDLSGMLKMERTQAKLLIQKFHQADKDGDGTISKEEFCTAMKLDLASPFTDNVFELLDPEGTGSFDFRTLVQGLIIVSGALGEQEKVKLIYSMYDLNADGTVTAEEIVQMILRKPATGANQSSSQEDAWATATKLMGDKEGLNLEEFAEVVKTHPEVMNYAIQELGRWLDGIVEVSVRESDGDDAQNRGATPEMKASAQHQPTEDPAPEDPAPTC